MPKTKLLASILLGSLAAPLSADSGIDNLDLDDIAKWQLLPMETCLDAVLDTIPGHPRKLELKIEGDDPTYEFEVDARNDGNTYNVECNAEEGLVTEIERVVTADDNLFKSLARVSREEALKMVLGIHPGRVVSEELEIGMDGKATYEFDIQTQMGPELKIDVDAATGEIEEVNVEIYEIGAEKE